MAFGRSTGCEPTSAVRTRRYLLALSSRSGDVLGSYGDVWRSLTTVGVSAIRPAPPVCTRYRFCGLGVRLRLEIDTPIRLGSCAAPRASPCAKLARPNNQLSASPGGAGDSLTYADAVRALCALDGSIRRLSDGGRQCGGAAEEAVRACRLHLIVCFSAASASIACTHMSQNACKWVHGILRHAVSPTSVARPQAPSSATVEYPACPAHPWC